MYLWRKTAAPDWLNASEEVLQTRSRGGLAVVAKPGSKRLQLEISCKSQRLAQSLLDDFGGRIEKLPRDWWQRLARKHGPKALKIGKRLIVVRSVRERGAARFPRRLIVPAGAAFGTGEHQTTAMSLRLLDGLTRTWKHGWSLVDLGTGSGILALAAARFGARRVLGIDFDPTAISTAKANARLNKIDSVTFCIRDARRWKSRRKIDVVTANLFSELLIQILPNLKRSNWLILSGVLHAQEMELVRALRRGRIDIVEVRRRGKWIALLAKII